jgi:carboxylesterase
MPELFDPRCAPVSRAGSNGEAVVLVHGFTGSPAYFEPLSDFLHDHGYTVVVPRLAGHGTSLDDLADTTADDWIASARQAVDDVADHRRVHLAGLSMGGLISLILAQPTAASSVTTINSPVVVHDKRLYVAPLVAPFRDFAETSPVPTPELDPEMSDLWQLTYQGGAPVSAVAGLVQVVWRAVLAARRLRRPSLVIQSRRDPVVDPISGKILDRLLGPETRLVWLEGVLHNVLVGPERDRIHDELLSRIRNV